MIERKTMHFLKAFLVLMMAMVSTAAMASSSHDHHNHGAVMHGELMLENIRIKAVMPGAKVTAGYLDITNKGNVDDRLIGVRINGANKAEIHSMEMDGGIMKMRPLKDGIALPKGEMIALQPGGLHLMFMKLDGFPKKGEEADLTLIFEIAGEVTLKAPVKKIKPGHGTHSH